MSAGLEVLAYAAIGPTGPILPTTIRRRPVGAQDVLIDILYAGICHSDIHTVRGDWGPVTYPQVVGHEIIGTVRAVGPAVTRHRVGDLVGVGVQSNSCRECEQCRAGREQYCVRGVIQTYNSVDVDGSITQGGYAQATVIDEHSVLSIPDGLDPRRAAPLLCAGITLYSPLRHWGAGPGRRVAIVGMGGLGHIGVMLAAAMGAEVTVLSRTAAKRDDALRLGAHEYWSTDDPATADRLAGRFDLVISTLSAAVDLTDQLRTLVVDGVLVLVGAPAAPVSLDVQSLLSHRRSVVGSSNGGIAETQEMLDFCAAHGVQPEVEVIPASEIDAAYERVLRSDVRYRFVVDVSTMGQR